MIDQRLGPGQQDADGYEALNAENWEAKVLPNNKTKCLSIQYDTL